MTIPRKFLDRLDIIRQQVGDLVDDLSAYRDQEAVRGEKAVCRFVGHRLETAEYQIGEAMERLK